MNVLKWGLIAVGLMSACGAGPLSPREVRVPFEMSQTVSVAEVVTRLAEATGVAVSRPAEEITLPTNGLAGNLTRRMLAESLGPDVTLVFQPDALLITIDAKLFEPGRLPQWEARLRRLAARAEREARRRLSYGLHALASYRPNDPKRPTVCLVHGLNSSSGGFVHMIAPLEAAGFGIVVYDYPYNRDLDESCLRFRRDWLAFRKELGESRSWAILAHSMGALLARSYVEDPKAYAHDVSTLILIGPVNQGSSLAKAQNLLQLVEETQAVKGQKTTDPLARLGDGLGEAASDMLPGSAFLKALNRRPRNEEVTYHILAGDAGFLPTAARRRIEDRLDTLRNEGGLLGGLARLALRDLASRLDEVSEGFGDGCVSVARTRLDGVADHVTIHANHAELIRAPLLFPDAGPVVCMPFVLRWLNEEGVTTKTQRHNENQQK